MAKTLILVTLLSATSILFSKRAFAADVVTSDEPVLFCEYIERRKFTLYTSSKIVEANGERTAKINSDVYLPMGSIVPCDKFHPISKEYWVMRTNRGDRYVKHPKDFERKYVRAHGFDDTALILRLKGAHGSVRVLYDKPAVEDVNNNGIAAVTTLDEFELLNAVFIYDYTSPWFGFNEDKLFYKVRVLPGHSYREAKEGWILAEEFGALAKRRMNRPAPKPQPTEITEFSLFQSNQLVGLFGQKVEAISWSDMDDTPGKIIRSHLWDKLWKGAAPYVELDGFPISRAELYAIDALARTLYGEIRLRACRTNGTHFIKGLTKTILNRADFIRIRGLVRSKPFVRAEQLVNGFDPRGKERHLLIPIILESYAQYSPWNPHVNSPWNPQGLKAGQIPRLLHIKPGNVEEGLIWKEMVNISMNAVLTDSIDKAASQVKQYFFTHGKKTSPWGSAYTIADDGAKIDGEEINSKQCLQRWNTGAYPDLDELN